MEGVGLRVKCVFGFCQFNIRKCYGTGINVLPFYFYEPNFFLEHMYYFFISASDLLFCFDLPNYNCTVLMRAPRAGAHGILPGEGSCCCCFYQLKVKSIPRFGLSWEFDKSCLMYADFLHRLINAIFHLKSLHFENPYTNG